MAGPDTIWELVFLMVILKIPIVYLCTVVYYAIKAEPPRQDGAAVAAQIGPEDGGGGTWRRSRTHPRRPRGGPARTYPRTARAARAYAERR